MIEHVPITDEPPTSLQELQDSREALLFMLEDLEVARQQIERSHQEWVAALDVVNDPIFLHDKQFRILRCNKAYQRCAEMPFTQLIGQPYYEIFPKTGAPLPCCLRALEKSAEEEEEEEEIVVGSVTYRTRAYTVPDEQGGYLYSVHTLEDITEQKRMAATVVESEEKFRKISESAQDAIIMMGPDQRISFWNTASERIFGYTAAEALGQELHELIVPETARAAFRPAFPRFLATGEGAIIGKRIEVSALHKEKREFPVELSISATKLNNQWHAIAIVRDITERKQLERQKELDNLRMRASLQLDRMVNVDEHTVLDFVLEQAIPLTESGYGFISKISDDSSKMIVQVWSRDVIQACAVAGEPIEFEIAQAGVWAESVRTRNTFILNDYSAAHPHKHGMPPGHVAIQRFMAVPIFDDERLVMIAAVANKQNDYVIADASRLNDLVKDAWRMIQRNQAERALLNSNRALRTISGGNQALIQADDEDTLLHEMCRVAVERGGYRMAWVGYVRDDTDKGVQPVASCGFEDGYLDSAKISWAENEHGDEPIGRAIRNKQTIVCQDITGDPHIAPWLQSAKERGYAACIALPLMNREKCFGVFVLCSAERAVFASEEVGLLEEMAKDLAYGILTLRVRKAHQRHERLVQENMLKTVKAIAGIVEMRDPYTSGHQARVAELAQAIGRQLGLGEEEVHAIFLAGLVHDLGKVRIPAEILSKPGHLDDVEFSLIKKHAQAGYDILKDIDFAWPIAQMVLQHHERMDGSGYPQGLRGEAILLGARILCVADVVEAMSSHRPYRPGLGIPSALAELERGRGTVYDPQVVDACLILFKEKKYVLPH